MSINDYSDGLFLSGAIFLAAALVAAIAAGMVYNSRSGRRLATVGTATATIGFLALLVASWLAVIGR